MRRLEFMRKTPTNDPATILMRLPCVLLDFRFHHGESLRNMPLLPVRFIVNGDVNACLLKSIDDGLCVIAAIECCPN